MYNRWCQIRTGMQKAGQRRRMIDGQVDAHIIAIVCAKELEKQERETTLQLFADE